MKLNNIKYFLIAATLFASCRKYVDDTPVTNTRTLTTTDDYRLLMNTTGAASGGVEGGIYTSPVLSGIDVYFTDSAYQASFSTFYAPVYTWASVYFDANSSDLNWENPYAAIYTYNTVITGIGNSKNGTDSAKNEIKAEAMIHRAYSYWALVNCYGKQYDSTSSGSDLGVPLLLAPDFQANLTRASVQSVYNQVIADIKNAIPYLPNMAVATPYPSKVAAYALMARVMQFTRNFTAASLYADSALALKSNIADYNSYIQGSTLTYPTRFKDPEIILSKQQNGSFYPLQIHPDILNLLGTADLRYQLFTRPSAAAFYTWNNARVYWRTQYTYENNNIGLTTPELYLIKAESQARAGNISTALTYLNQLRIKRYAAADYIAATASSISDIMTLIVNERKKEFFGRGYVWFDQKRLNKDAQFATPVSRAFQGVTYTLSPNSNLYVYPIGLKYIGYNPEIQQNPR